MNISELESRLKKTSPIEKKDFEPFLLFLDKKTTRNLICDFLMMTTKGDDIRENDFLEFLKDNIIFYVLNYDEYQKQIKGKKEDVIRKTIESYQKAKSKFQKKSRNTGEVAELLLFLLLESCGVSKIVSKMLLKTSSDMPVFGSDAVHLEIDNGKLIIHYGEAKMRKTFPASLKDAISSIETFESNHKEVDEINIITSNIDRARFGKYAKELTNMLNPYSKDQTNFYHTHSVLLCFDWNVLNNTSQKGTKKLKDYLISEYQTKQTEYLEKINSEIKSDLLKDKNFRFFILPFKNETQFSIRFNEEI